jgi:toxin ParE1/3/4
LRVIFRPEAEREVQQAYVWYEERQPELGATFLERLEACVQIISRHPELFPVVYKHVRQAPLRRFPYLVLYFIAADTVIIIAVFHASRDPETWKRRA